MKVSVCLVLLFAAVCRGLQDCPAPSDPLNCKVGTVLCCDANFQDTLNLTAACGNTATFGDPFCMRRVIEQMYEMGGPNGLLKVCSAFNVYDNCLGIAEEACVSALFFVSHGIKPIIAEEFVRLYRSFHFACGGGLNAYLQHDTCMGQVFQTQADVLRQCRDQYIANIQQDPTMACGYASIALNCFQAPFAAACGGEAGYWACEYERTSLSAFLPQCSSQCGMAQQGTIG
uniref:Uncharacterized protein n=1 Tax=Plectus sambesii TaxID=2011161 RepID=A0A914X5B1_9BILA